MPRSWATVPRRLDRWPTISEKCGYCPIRSSIGDISLRTREASATVAFVCPELETPWVLLNSTGAHSLPQPAKRRDPRAHLSTAPSWSREHGDAAASFLDLDHTASEGR